MAIRPVLRLGDPRLFKVARKITEFNTPELENLIQYIPMTLNLHIQQKWQI